MGLVVKSDSKILRGKSQQKKLLKSQGMCRGEANSDLGNHLPERESEIYSYNETIQETYCTKG